MFFIDRVYAVGLIPFIVTVVAMQAVGQIAGHLFEFCLHIARICFEVVL